MPPILELFLSYNIILILFVMYLLAMLIVVFGFKIGGIKRRIDVIFRSSIMHGTYIFLSHALGVMFYSLVLIILHINVQIITVTIDWILTLVSMGISVIIYIYFANYLWMRIALSKHEARNLIIKSLVFVIPWYFILNLI